MRRSLVALVAAALAVAGACGSPAHRSTSSRPAAPATTPTTAVPVAIATAAGARLTPPKAPTNKAADADPSCPTLVDAGFQGSCRLANGAHSVAALVDEHANPGNEHRVLVYRKTSEGFSLALRFSEADAGTPANALVSDVAQDDDPKIVVTYHDVSQGDTSGVPTLNGIDVIEATGTVVVHRDLSHGQAGPATGGGLETWSRVDGTSPLMYRHQVIRYHEGDWRVETDERVPATSVPEPDPRGGALYN